MPPAELELSDREEASVKIQSFVRRKQSQTVVQRLLKVPVEMAGVVGSAYQRAAGMVAEAGHATGRGFNAAGQVFTGPPPPRLSDTEVSESTPPDRWYKPRTGWTCTDDKGRVPHIQLPTATSAEILFPVDKEIIGTLRVEVLQAKGLPNKDAMLGLSLPGNMTDSYAFVVFEGNAARTSVVRDSCDPRWGGTDPESFRAFEFPVTKPYSVLYVCVNDFDGGKANEKVSLDEVRALSEAAAKDSPGSRKNKPTSKRSGLNGDDAIGRVAITLGRLTAGTSYDCWYELGHAAIDRPDGTLGSIRLRYSVTFPSERTRMLAYLGPEHTFLLPFKSPRHRKNAIFAKRGGISPTAYDWDVLMKYVDELKLMIKLVVQLVGAIENVIFWRLPAIGYSAYNCVITQVLLSYPNFFPAHFSIGVIMILMATYHMPQQDARLDSKLAARPPFCALLASLLFNRSPTPLEHNPDLLDAAANEKETSKTKHQKAQAASFSVNAPSTLNAATLLVADRFRDAATAYWYELIFGYEASDGKPEPKEETLDYQIKLINEDVEEFKDEGDDSEHEKLLKKERANSRIRNTSFIPNFNPMATALGPVQAALADAIPKVRKIRYLIFWNDRIVTFWLVALLAATAVGLALIPWGFVLYWTARLAGLLLLGPHMHFVGKWIDKKRAEARKKATEYREASPEEREKILDTHREKLMAEAHAHVEKARAKEAKRSAREKARYKYLANQKCIFLNANTPGNANMKYVAVADPTRSSARPLSSPSPKPPAAKPPKDSFVSQRKITEERIRARVKSDAAELV